MRRFLFIILAIFLSSHLHAQSFTWTRTTSSTTENLWGVCYGSNQFVAVGTRGTILTSPDGTTWTTRSSGTSAWLTAICYANGMYLAVGDNGTILTSPDALTWTSRSASGVRLNGIAHGNGRFVAVGEAGTVRSSINGEAWTSLTLPIDTWLRGIVYGPDCFLIGAGDGTLCSTEDGTTFRFAGTLEHSAESLVTSGGTTIAVGEKSRMSGSADRLHWTAKATPAAGNYRGLTKSGASVLAVGDAGSILYTDFTPTMTSVPVTYALDAPNLNGVAAGPRKVVIVGDNGTIFVSLPNEPEAPRITGWSMSSGSAFVGGSATLSASVGGSSPLTFEWSRAGIPIASGTTDVLRINSLTEQQTGTYKLTAKNSAGTASIDITIPKLEPAPSAVVDPRFRAEAIPGVLSIFDVRASHLSLPGGQLLLQTSRGRLLRFNADGSWDLSFNTPANLTLNTVTPAGSVLVNTSDSTLKRLRNDGSIDQSFSASTDNAQVIGLANGRIVSISLGTAGATLRRFNADGSLDSTYPVTFVELHGPGASSLASFNTILHERDADGGIFTAAVSMQSIGTGYFGANETRLFRLRSDGTLDASFAALTLNDSLTQLVRVEDRLYCQAFWRSGSLGSSYSHKFFRLDLKGAPDPAYTPVVLSSYYARPSPILLNDGGILATATEGLVRYTPAGSRDDTFNGRLAYDALGKIDNLIPLEGGKILVVGSFETINGIPSRGLAQLTIPVRDAATRLVNLSIRTNAGSGDQTLIAGFVIGGSGNSRSVLMRGLGPGLVPLGLNAASVTADPQLKLFKGSSTIASNDDWNSSLESTASAVGAYPLTRGSKDAAMLSTLAPGPYTVHINNAVNASGITLVELFDADGAPTSSSAARLVNVSGRARVGTGDNVLIAGFVLEGKGTKQLLIRAVGPGLSRQGVTDYLSDPELIIYRGTNVVASNDNWPANDPTMSALFTAVGAFALDAGSRDAAVALELEPGVYTALVRGVGNTTGSALIEVYDVL